MILLWLIFFLGHRDYLVQKFDTCDDLTKTLRFVVNNEQWQG